jgi:hypothetical protein
VNQVKSRYYVDWSGRRETPAGGEGQWGDPTGAHAEEAPRPPAESEAPEAKILD